eukprot:84974-Rhodomonas_salina.1
MLGSRYPVITSGNPGTPGYPGAGPAGTFWRQQQRQYPCTGYAGYPGPRGPGLWVPGLGKQSSQIEPLSSNQTSVSSTAVRGSFAFPPVLAASVRMNWGLSFDVVAEARNQRNMLRAVHTCGKNLYAPGKELDNAIEAYEKVFMPRLHDALAGKREYEAPTIEVAWVWHLHKLDPAAYNKDCLAAFGM